MREIRLLTDQDLDVFVNLVANAYPGMKIVSAEDRERTKQRLLEVGAEDDTVSLYGLFQEGRLLGGMRLHDFTMNMLGISMPAGGVGLIAVHLAYKKEHVAKAMVEYFLRHCRERGAPIALLYPFRPDFYKQMGFGYGTKMNHHRIKPADLPRGPSKAHVRYLGTDDLPALSACYHRVARRTHGMIDKCPYEIRGLRQAPPERIVGYVREGRVEGYLVLGFEHGETFIVNDILLREFVYETREALYELLTFLHTQADQIRYVILNTQDEWFHYLLQDPRDNPDGLLPRIVAHQSNLQGLGVMYRVVDVPGILERLREHNFGGQSCRLDLVVEDTFLPENAGRTALQVEDGYLQPDPCPTADVEVTLGIATCSTLLMGTVPFRRLYTYGLADISDPAYVDTVDALFAVRDKPVCTTPF